MTDPAYPSATRAWLAVVVLMVLYIFSYLDRTILTLLIGPIRHDLHISDTQISLLHGLAFAILYGGLGLPIGRLVDSRHRVGIISIGVLVWSVMTAACGLTRTFGQLFLTRIGVGVGEAALSPAAYSIIADYFPPEKLSRALSAYMASTFIGLALAYVVGGGLATALQGVSWRLPIVGPVWGWHIVFLLVGLPGLVLTVLIWTVREPRRRGALREAGLPVRSAPLREVLAFVALNWRIYSVAFIGFGLISLVFNSMTLWTPTLLVRIHGWSVGQAGMAFGPVVGVFGGGGLYVGGWLSDHRQKRGHRDACIFVAAAGSALGIIPTILTPLMPSGAGVLVMMAPALFFGNFPGGVAVSALQQITPNQMRGQVSAIYLFFLTLLGIGGGPLLVAMTTDYVFHSDLALGLSMAIVDGASAIVATILLVAGLRPYVASHERADAWKLQSQ